MVFQAVFSFQPSTSTQRFDATSTHRRSVVAIDMDVEASGSVDRPVNNGELASGESASRAVDRRHLAAFDLADHRHRSTPACGMVADESLWPEGKVYLKEQGRRIPLHSSIPPIALSYRAFLIASPHRKDDLSSREAQKISYEQRAR